MGSIFSSPKSTIEDIFDETRPLPPISTVPSSPPDQPLHIEGRYYINVCCFNFIIFYKEECVPRFEANDPQLVSYLQENGYVVIKNAASEDDVANAKCLLWKFLEEKCAMMEHDPMTWTDENFCKIGSTQNGILAYGGINQSQFVSRM
jgi:hypothetical protein